MPNMHGNELDMVSWASFATPVAVPTAWEIVTEAGVPGSRELVWTSTAFLTGEYTKLGIIHHPKALASC